MSHKKTVDLLREQAAARNGTPSNRDGEAPGRGRDVRNNKPPGETQQRPFRLDLIDSATFAAGDYSLTWLVKNVLVKGQPCVLGGPKKSLKTSIGVDLAVSVAAGRKFLGEFYTPEPCRVCVLSGESGQATLQNLARRVAAAKGLKLADLDILWGFQLPQLANEHHVEALHEALEVNKVKLLLFDPLYLALLSGQGAEGLSPANLYQMGPQLLAVSQACLDAGCTPILFHHFKLTRKDVLAPPQLEDLAFAGIQEFARQWILLGHRSRFDPDDTEGRHKLWLNVGGSAGHSLLRAVDVCEGKLDADDFGGRVWRVEVALPTDARAAAKDDKKIREQKDDESRVLAIIDKLDPERNGMATKTKIRERSPLSRPRTDAALCRLVDEKILEEVEVQIDSGHGAKQKAIAYRRPGQKQGQEGNGVSGVSNGMFDTPDTPSVNGMSEPPYIGGSDIPHTVPGAVRPKENPSADTPFSTPEEVDDDAEVF
jgi:hypothetical protein